MARYSLESFSNSFCWRICTHSKIQPINCRQVAYKFFFMLKLSDKINIKGCKRHPNFKNHFPIIRFHQTHIFIIWVWLLVTRGGLRSFIHTSTFKQWRASFPIYYIKTKTRVVIRLHYGKFFRYDRQLHFHWTLIVLVFMITPVLG